MIDLYKLETAACLWEAALALLTTQITTDVSIKVNEYCEGFGTGDLRLKVIELADECDAEFELIQDGYPGCFDWDFVPDFLERKIKAGLLDA